ncbi:MAG: hypothetical protein ACK58Q_02530 [Chitinophagales bacterium]|jgi:predicted translin family RNA/ssDNA-binding protein
MKKEEYLEKKKIINDKIESLKLELKNLDNSLILTNAQFNIGEKVILGKGTKKERFAYVYNIGEYWGEINYKFLKSKKDGEMSKNMDWLGYMETISKID